MGWSSLRTLCKKAEALVRPAFHENTYNRWQMMNRRCSDPKNQDYKNYGARGIKVCARWRVFENFVSDMGHAPDGMSLERIDNNGPYSPENCKWATRTQQVKNRRSTLWLEHNGERLTVAEWSRRTGIKYHTLKIRIRRGYPPDWVLASGNIRALQRSH